ncbi:winged helix-turn-helix domain-containing protein [Pedobacter panaciterrae]|uniref:ModE family transcriptional regulator n=1 Tax=Pedobacter panaciterrae TaxID=363849 RepID=A0ABU8NU56_9SPHI
MNGQTNFKLNGRIWIETPTGKVLGHGRVELLERIHASGSLRQAALQMKMSYKQAWDLVQHINGHFDDALVVLSRGGTGGGKAIVTEKGLDMIAEFKKLQEKFTEFLKQEENSIKI